MARRKLAEHGIDCTGKTARQLTNSDYGKRGLLTRMEQTTPQNMHRICGGNCGDEMHLHDTDHSGDAAVSWYTGDFERTRLNTLEDCKRQLSYR